MECKLAGCEDEMQEDGRREQEETIMFGSEPSLIGIAQGLPCAESAPSLFAFFTFGVGCAECHEAP